MYNKRLWNLFLSTGNLGFYLELKNYETEESSLGEQNENIEFGEEQNITLR